MRKKILFNKTRLYSALIGAGYLTFFAADVLAQSSGCNPLQPYDQIQSGFHTTIASRPDGTFLIWGAGSTANGNGAAAARHLTPVVIEPNAGIPAQHYNYTGAPLFATLATQSSTTTQVFVMSTDGLYSWGANNVAIGTGLDNVAGFAQISMPVGIVPGDIKNMIASWGALVLLTHSGEVYVSGRNDAIHGNGGVLPGAAENYWARVTRDITGNPPLTGVVDIRVTPAGAFAITSTGQWYTWGPRCYRGDGSAVTTYNRAVAMTTPFSSLPVMIAMTADFGNNTWNDASNRATYYAINPADNKLYAMGSNGNGQLGQGNTTNSTGWVPVRNSTNTADLVNVIFVSANDNDGSPGTPNASVSVILSNGELWSWGSNNNEMIGVPGGTGNHTLPKVPNGFIQGTDHATYVEIGGHTTAIMKLCAERYCYMGHKIDGSMGDGVSATSTVATFDCANTPVGLICGSSTYDAGDVPFSYESGNPAAHYYMCGDDIYLGATQPDPDNGLSNKVAPGANNTGTNGDGADEDGLVTPLSHATVNPNFSTTLTFTNNSGTSANIYAWVDWNNDGVFSANEVFTTSAPSAASSQTTNILWNSISTSCGNKYARVRITTETLTDNPATAAIDERSFGPVIHGEVEDFLVDVDILTDLAGDCDGDGVTNGQEITDGTDPGNACNFTLASQGTPSAAWNTADCDGDGVTNEQEVTDGTDPLDPCELQVASITLSQSGSWLSGDCDGDGVTNGEEVSDGTDPNNPCDFVLASQSVMPDISWNNGDCDGDGVANSTEVTDGTNPLNACEYNTTHITLPVTGTNCPPVANGNAGTTNEDTPITINVPSNDTDDNGNLDNTSVTVVNQPSNGTVTVNPVTGEITYTPNPNFNGIDTLIYSICDTGMPVLCDTALVIITVTPVNDAPVANGDTATTSEDTPVVINVPSNDTDVDGNLNNTSVTVVTPPSNGTVTIDPVTGEVTYTPDSGFSGTDTLIYSICDTGMPVLCDTAIVVITVNAVNHPPVANEDTATTNEDTPVVIDVPSNDTDVDGNLDNTSVTVVNPPSNGTVTIDPVTGEITYTPDANFNGNDTLIYSICDTGMPVVCDTALVIITVTPVNDGPVANEDAATTNEDTPVVIDVPSNDTDVDGNLDNTSVTVVTPPSNGTVTIDPVTGEVTYTPDSGFSGNDTLIYSICDTGMPVICDTTFVIITVTPVNDAPVANEDTATTDENTPVVIDVPSNDTDSDGNLDNTSVTVVTPPSNGTVTIDPVTGEVTYTPNPGFNGNDTLIYSICDTGMPVLCDTAMIIITVTPCLSDPSKDCDGDGVTNGNELTDGTDPSDPCDFTLASQTLTPATAWNNADCDGDGVTNGTEVTDGTDPNNPCDLTLANQTVTPNTAWNNADCDGDGVTNGTEVTDGTDPNNPCDLTVANQTVTPTTAWNNGDCDGDGVTNGTEVTDGTDPNNPCDLTVANQTVTPGTIWNNADCDGDGVTNGTEVTDGTDPNNPCDFTLASQTVTPNIAWNSADCDGDGVTNGTEVTDGTDPNNPCDLTVASQTVTPGTAWNNGDCDGDGVINGTEVTDGTDPNNPCDFTSASQTVTPGTIWSNADCDGDGVTNGQEVTDGTNPDNPCDYTGTNVTLTQGGDWNTVDCDGDGVINGTEVTNGTNPNNPCDFILANQTVTPGTAWNNADCDGDGITNGEEVSAGSNPLDSCDPKSCGITVPNAFTPDGDGINEVWVIEGIEKYPENQLMIYNRWGNLVYSADKYLNTWGGTSDSKLNVGGEELPTGTYFYVLDTKDAAAGVLKGYVYIQR
ncbi:tandem-95 repeat protein [Fluviicola taffensis]|uniref:Outer membrane adhesin like protein n=1 Tax=Fluviicola taffensis (strain DSM 16823 / NCIMB 13979 / RW262) TaxID=755732 RepID=F2IB01_FLUTR|nr:Ig-like domain-containing protein [Fluviicola taffensis]AEA45325.1 outer membrane adhesin like protein [Fluviicola taffensis DSM 16823]